MAIPGANVRLGQGYSGGGGGLPGGLPLPGGGLTGPPLGLIPRPTIPKNAVGAASVPPISLPTTINTDPRVASQVGSGLSSVRDAQNLIGNPGSTQSLTAALGILAKVEKGSLKPERAAKMMQGLTPGDQGKLADLISGHFSRTGAINRNVLKALQSLQSLPAPEDAQPHSLLDNLAKDTEGLITGLPAGIGLAATYGAKDIGNELIPGNKPTSNFYDKILKPVGQTYKQEYSPLIHGDFGGAYKQFHAHPLGPILDAASLFSAGAGTVGRVGRAGEAIDAARVADLTQAAVPGARLYHGSSHMGALDPAMGREGGIYLTPHPEVAKIYSGESHLYDQTYTKNIEERGKTHEIFLPKSAKIFDASQPVTPTIAGIADKIVGDEANLLREYHDQLDPQDHVYLQALDGLQARIKSGDLKSVDELRHEMVDVNSHNLHGSVDEPGGGVYEKFMQQMSAHLKGEGFSGTKLAAWPGDVREAQGPHGLNLGNAAPTDEHLIWDKSILQSKTGALASKDEVAPIGSQAAPKMGAIDKIRNYLDTGPKNNGDLDRLTRVQPSLKDFTGPPEDHPLDPVTGLSKVQLAKAGITGFVKPGPKGNLLELYDKARGNTHEAEIQNYMDEIGSVLANSNLRMGRRSMQQVISDVASDIRATRAEGKARPTEMAANLPGFISPNSSGRVLSAAETSLREASDMVRAGAIVLRPAYIPNNWAGNTFMNVVHQGAFAPINLAKSVVIHNHMDPQNLAALRKSMGTNPAEAITNPTGRGYVASLTQPIYHTMGLIADQPFRDAAFLHEARRAGYSTLKSIDDLFTKARMSEKAGAVGTTTEGDAALREIAQMSRKAQEEIVKFGHMNETERSVIRNLVFVYSWMRGAGRYAARFPAAHPIQTNLFNRLSGPGNQYIQSVMGGVPSFLAGSVPVGRDKNGNPILVNPFSLNPLGTGLQLAQAAAGTAHVIQDPKSFNKYAQNDVTSLLNPILGSYIDARGGGQPMKKQLENTMAFLALRKGLQHPGSGSIYPTTRAEALGHYTFGSLYPRAADQQAIAKALARQNVGHPAAMIPQQIKDFKKATGQDIPPQLVSAYQGDLEAIQMQKDFQSHYADSHGASGFRNMPPQNKVEAALQYLTQHSHIPPAQIAQLQKGAAQLTTDQEFNDYANSLWAMTGVGEYKRAWDDMLRSSKGSILTRKRK